MADLQVTSGLLPFVVDRLKVKTTVTQHVAYWLMVAKAKQIYAIWEYAV